MRARFGVAIGAVILTALLLDGTGGARPQEGAATAVPNDRDKVSYSVGYLLGEAVHERVVSERLNADPERLVEGFRDAVHGRDPAVPRRELQSILFAVHETMQRRMIDRLLVDDPEFRAKHDQNLERSLAFHTTFAKRDGVVTLRYTLTGTNDGEFFGTPATGKRFQIENCTLLEVVDGRVKRAWRYSDTLGLLTQLGLLPGPGPA